MRGDGAVFKPPNSRFYWIRYHLNGKEYRETTGTEDSKEAVQFLRKKMKEVGAAQLGVQKFLSPAQRKIKVSALLDGLKTDYEIRGKWNPRVRSHVMAVKDKLGQWPAAFLTKQLVDSYVLERQQLGRASATINNELQLLRQAYLISEDVGNGPKIRKLPVNNAREGFFERPAFEALVAKLPEALKDYARFGYLTGWRLSEISSLSWVDLDMEAHMMRLRHAESKNGEARKIPLEGELLEIFQRRWAARSFEGEHGETVLSELVFHRKGRPVKRFNRAWKTACENAGLKAGRKVDGGMIFHDLRRSAARNIRRAGVSEEIAMKITGHKTSSMFRRYNITNEADLKKAVKKTQEYVRKLPVKRENVLQFSKDAGGKKKETA